MEWNTGIASYTHIGEGVTTTVTGGVHMNHSNIWFASSANVLL